MCEPSFLYFILESLNIVVSADKGLEYERTTFNRFLVYISLKKVYYNSLGEGCPVTIVWNKKQERMSLLVRNLNISQDNGEISIFI